MSKTFSLSLLAIMVGVARAFTAGPLGDAK
jgi:hypothetical protein